MTSDLPAGDVIVLHDGNGRHAYHALTLAMVALDALSTDQSSRALGCAQGARYGCPKAAASSLEQIVSTKAGSFTHPKDLPTEHFWHFWAFLPQMTFLPPVEAVAVGCVVFS